MDVTSSFGQSLGGDLADEVPSWVRSVHQLAGAMTIRRLRHMGELRLLLLSTRRELGWEDFTEAFVQRGEGYRCFQPWCDQAGITIANWFSPKRGDLSRFQ